MVILDPPTWKKGNKLYSHLVATTIEELHAFCKVIGVNRCWYCNKKGKNRPHYDIDEAQVKRALEYGAVQVSSKQLVDFLKAHYK